MYPRGPHGAPLAEIVGDSLADRATLTAQANRLAMGQQQGVTYLPKRTVEAVRQPGRSTKFEVELGQMTERSVEANEVIACDSILAHVGFRPDCSIFSELQVQLCYVSEAPMNLAAHLLQQNSADCLQQNVPNDDLLGTSEPDYYILGNKSYGRDSRFLISIGLEQVRQVFSRITDNADLNLHRSIQVDSI